MQSNPESTTLVPDQPPASAEECEETPLGLDDLPDQCLGIILRKLKEKEKLFVTQASPSARRLSSGPKAEPDVLGGLKIRPRETGAESAIKLKWDTRSRFDFPFAVNFSAADFASQRPLLEQWLRDRARVFNDVCLEFSSNVSPSGRSYSDLVTSVLASLSDSYSGTLKIICSKLDPVDFPLLASVGSSFPQSHSIFYLYEGDLDRPDVQKLLSEFTTFKGAFLVWPSGAWSPNFFAKCEGMENLVIQNCVSFVRNLRFPSSWQTLRGLALRDLPYNVELAASLGSLSPSSLTSLETIELNIAYYDLDQVKALEHCPNLKYINLELAEHLHPDYPPRPPSKDLRISLPRLRRFKMTVDGRHDPDEPYHYGSDGDADEKPFRARFPLGPFSCPEVGSLELFFTLQDDFALFDPADFIASVDSLSGFPSLESLDIFYRFGNKKANLTFDLTKLDFNKCPDLQFFSLMTNGGYQLPEDPLSCNLDEMFNDEWVDKWGSKQVMVQFYDPWENPEASSLREKYAEEFPDCSDMGFY